MHAVRTQCEILAILTQMCPQAPQVLTFGSTLATRVPHCWQLSSAPHPLDLSSCTFNTRILGTRFWTIQQPSYFSWRQYGLHLPSCQDVLMDLLLCNQHLQLHQRQPEVKRVSLSLNCPLNMFRSSGLFGLIKRCFIQCLWKGHSRTITSCFNSIDPACVLHALLQLWCYGFVAPKNRHIMTPPPPPSMGNARHTDTSRAQVTPPTPAHKAQRRGTDGQPQRPKEC